MNHQVLNFQYDWSAVEGIFWRKASAMNLSTHTVDAAASLVVNCSAWVCSCQCVAGSCSDIVWCPATCDVTEITMTACILTQTLPSCNLKPGTYPLWPWASLTVSPKTLLLVLILSFFEFYLSSQIESMKSVDMVFHFILFVSFLWEGEGWPWRDVRIV